MVPATDMKVKQTILSVSVALGVLLVSVPRSLAHHSRMMFDMSQNVTYQGIVKQYRWENPHSHIVITVGPDAKNSSTAGTWNIEASSVNIMAGEGWSQMTYKPGDPITVVAHPMKNRSKGALLFYAIKPDGTRLYRAQHQYDSETE
ncbi:MAG: DUF6152 family protein [Candidatus Acidiferrales bacterium]|jgi:hypothetical protein